MSEKNQLNEEKIKEIALDDKTLEGVSGGVPGDIDKDGNHKVLPDPLEPCE